MEQEQDARVGRLQERINAALHEDLEATAESDFSEYMPDTSTPLTQRLAQAAQQGGLDGMEAALMNSTVSSKAKTWHACNMRSCSSCRNTRLLHS